MKIKTSITQEREIEINLPLFRKRIDHSMIEYIGVIEEGFVIKVNTSEDGKYTAVSLSERWMNEKVLLEAFEKWQEIEEYEFLQAHEDALQSLSLAPKLCEVDREIEDELTNKDDLKGIEFS